MFSTRPTGVTNGDDVISGLGGDADAAQEMTIRLTGVHAVDAGIFVL